MTPHKLAQVMGVLGVFTFLGGTACGSGGRNGQSSGDKTSVPARDSQDRSPDQPCANNTDCPEGQVCERGVCMGSPELVPVGEFVENADRDSDHSCLNGACSEPSGPGPEAGCLGDTDCSEGDDPLADDCEVGFVPVTDGLCCPNDFPQLGEDGHCYEESHVSDVDQGRCSVGFVQVGHELCCPEAFPLLGTDGLCHEGDTEGGFDGAVSDGNTFSGQVSLLRTWNNASESLGPGSRTLPMRIVSGPRPQLMFEYNDQWHTVTHAGQQFPMQPYANTTADCTAAEFLITPDEIHIELICEGTTRNPSVVFPEGYVHQFEATLSVTGRGEQGGLRISVEDRHFFSGLGNAQWEGTSFLHIESAP